MWLNKSNNFSTIDDIFEAPINRNIKIWRYMDFTKYVSFLDSKSLFFSRSDSFDDPYEGATSHANVKIRPKIYKDSGIREDALKALPKFYNFLRQWTYINCWHMNEHESAAMWKLYPQMNEAIVVQSTYQKLFNCLPSENVYLGVVKYIDYENDFIPEDNSFWPYIHKRKSFEHERELRAVVQEHWLSTEDNKIDWDVKNEKFGKSISINVNQLVENVYVSPESPQWFIDLVENVTKKYGFTFQINKSILAKEPEY